VYSVVTQSMLAKCKHFGEGRAIRCPYQSKRRRLPDMDVGTERQGAEGPVAGSTASVDLLVTVADTAIAVGSGEVPVLATPRVVALAEAASVAATAGTLPAGSTSVATHVELDHLAATAVGRTVTAEAILTTVDGRKLEFEVTAREGATIVAQGRVHRVVVDRDRFLARVAPA
jgi:fluoroacetyl-CoA thioesterase